MEAAAEFGETWSGRSEFWQWQGRDTKPRKRREKAKSPLVLTGHGVAMSVDGGCLKIRNGRTHYPQEPETFRFFPGSNDIPPRIIMLDGSGYVSFDVLEWLAIQRVPLVQLNWKGEAVTVAGGCGYATDPAKVDWQRRTRAAPILRLEFSRSIIRRKLENSVLTLREFIEPSPVQRAAIQSAELGIEQLTWADDLTAVRGIEAICASAYFRAWRTISIQWKTSARRPIPEDWRTFTSRTSLANNGKLLNINASHPINGMLNYAYGVLETEMRIRAVADGYDPTIGIMHHGRREKSAYIFDLMEPERPKVDAMVLEFTQTHEFSAADFTLRSDGVVRLSPQLARAVCGAVQRAGAGILDTTIGD